MEALRIRPFRPDDQDQARALVLAGLAEHFEHFDPVRNPDLVDIAGSYPAPNNWFIVAELESSLIGTAALIRETPRRGRIVRMSVAADFRRQGIAHRMVEMLIQTAGDNGMSLLVVETNNDWLGAIQLYSQCGFTPVDHRNGELHFAMDLAARANNESHPIN